MAARRRTLTPLTRAGIRPRAIHVTEEEAFIRPVVVDMLEIWVPFEFKDLPIP
jgi:hypothetical protein